MKTILLAAAVVGLAGGVTEPAGEWKKQGASQSDLERDRKMCERLAKMATAGSASDYQTYYVELVSECLEDEGYRYERKQAQTSAS